MPSSRRTRLTRFTTAPPLARPRSWREDSDAAAPSHFGLIWQCGNVWYLGEATTEYEDGRPVSTEGSWEAGVDGAQAGVVMPANPRVGMQYRQEYYAGHAEDAGRVLSTGEQVEVPFGHFTNVLLTKDYTPLEPKVLEYKLYAKGVGPVLTFTVSGGSDHEELVRFTKG